MRNAVIRKNAITLRALMNSPVRLMLGTTIREENLKALQESRLWAVPTPTYGTAK